MTTEFSNKHWLYEDTVLVGLERPDSLLPQVECYGTEIRGAKLSAATLNRWVFEDCRFVQCDMSNVRFSEVSLHQCKFSECRLFGVDWRLANPFNFSVSFEHCQLAYSNFSGLSLNHLLMESSDCSHVDFSEATLNGADFSGSSLQDAIFEQSEMRDVNFSTARQVRFDPRVNILQDTQLSLEDALAVVRLFGIVPS
ncbi:MAG: pentapeptide repeat-containing protein [Bradymonadia bacterium]